MLRKGQMVEFDLQGKIQLGRVYKGGSKKIIVILLGGSREVSAPPQAFRVTTKSFPSDDPSIMDGYSIKAYKSIGGEETDCFTATIKTPRGEKISVRNHGIGGCNFYHGDQSTITKLRQDAQAWSSQFDNPFESEQADSWVSWWLHSRPYGITAKANFAKVKMLTDTRPQEE